MQILNKLGRYRAFGMLFGALLLLLIAPITSASEDSQFLVDADGTTQNWMSGFSQAERDFIVNSGNGVGTRDDVLASPLEAWTNGRTIEGYASASSINKGESINFHVSATAATSFSLVIYRMGWYNGAGGRFVFGATGIPVANYGVPAPSVATRLVEANWPVAYTLNTDASWQTGAYMAKFIIGNGGTGNESYAPFVVRDDGGSQPILFVLEVSTWQAYNYWGGHSLYSSQSVGGNRAYEVSFDRPYQDWTGAGYFFEGDYQMIRFLEREGYNVGYATSIDLETNPNLLNGREMMLSNYHDEYYSWQMRDTITNARNNGVDLAFLTSNNVYWQVRFRNSSNGVANRIMVCYKDAVADPMASSATPQYTTVQWRQPPVNRPENELLGVMYQDLFNQPNYAWIVQNSSHWLYNGTGLSDGSSIPGVVGYEWDMVFNNGLTPSGLILLSNSPVLSGNATASIYTHASGARVLDASTNYWALALDDTKYDPTNGTVNANMQIMARNVLNNMGSVSPTAPPVGPHYIFDDASTWEWENNNTPTGSISFENTSVTYSGSRSMSFTPSGSNRISFMNSTTFSTAPYDTLRVALRSAGPTAKAITIQLGDVNANVFASYIIPELPPIGSWLVKDIPLTSLSAVNKTVKYIWIRSASAQSTVYVDEVVFLKTSSNTAPTTSGIANVVVNEDAPNSVINLWSAFADAQTADNALTYTIQSNSNAALFTSTAIDGVTTGNLTLDFAPDANGTANVVVRATDAGGLFVDAPFTVTVNSVNDAPSFTNAGNRNHPAGTSTAQTVSGWASSFVYGPANESTQTVLNFVVTVTSNPNNIFSVAPSIANNGTLTYTPNGTAGVATISVQLRDNGGTANGGVDLSTAQSFTITVANNTAPTTSGLSSVTVNEDSANTVLDLFATFADAESADNALTYTIQSNSNAALFTSTAIDGTLGTLTLDYAPDLNGTATIVVRATDPGSLFVDTVLTVTVNSVNDAPSYTHLGNQSYIAGTNTAQTISNWAYNFVFGPTNESAQTVADFVVIVTTNPNNIFSVAPDVANNGTLTFTPNGTSGTATVSVQLRDSGGTTNGGVDLSTAQTFDITVGNNTAPTTSGIAGVNVNEDSVTTVIDLFATFADVETPDANLTFTVESNTTPGLFYEVKIDAILGTLSLVYDANTNGTSALVVRATDAGGLFVESTFTVILNAVNDEPTFSNLGNQNLPAGTNTAQTVANWANTFVYGPANESSQAVQAFVVGIATDPNNIFSVAPAVANNGTLTFTPNGTAGTATINVQLRDNGGVANGGDDLSAIQTLTITVSSNSNPTTSGIATVNVIEDAPNASVDLFSAFADVETPDNALVYTLETNSNTALFTSTIIDTTLGMLILDFAPDANGIANLTMRATDANGFFVDTTFTVNVTAVNDAPNFSNLGNRNHVAGTTAAQTVTNWAQSVTFGPADESTQAVVAYTVTVVTDPNNIFTTPPSIDTAGTLTYTPNGTVGVATLSVTLQDNGGVANGGVDTSNAQTFTVTIANNNVPTTSGILDVTVNANASNTLIDLFGAVSDVEDADTALTYAVQNNTNTALFTAVTIDSTLGKLTLDYAPNTVGTATIIIRVTDTIGQFVDISFVVTVNPDSVPPKITLVNTTPDTGDGQLVGGESIGFGITQIIISYSEDVVYADDLVNFWLFSDGSNNTFETIDCATGVPSTDQVYSFNTIFYDATNKRTILTLGAELPIDNYRLMVCGTTSVEDLIGNKLDGNGDGVGADDLNLLFSITGTGVAPVNAQVATAIPQGSATIVKTVSTAFVSNGDSVTYTILVTNNSVLPIDNATVEDKLPDALELLSATSSLGTATINGQNVRVTIGQLGAGQSATVTVNATVRTTKDAPIILNNACLTYTNGERTCSSAQLLAVETLPQTGETPWWRPLVLIAMGILGAGMFWWVRRFMR